LVRVFEMLVEQMVAFSLSGIVLKY
jgi:hypothetical protein